MSREIKFRAWGKAEETMCENIQDRSDFKHFLKDKNIKVMQYTGLKDKNGTEIYEGDILKYSHKAVGSIVREVVYKSGAFGIEGTVKGTHIIFGNILESEREVIGNIYKNSELLNEGL